MPSTFPEAFGMVAVEAAACGTLPVSAGHSGMLEVSRQLQAGLPEAVGDLTSFPVAVGAVEGIAAQLECLAGAAGDRAGAMPVAAWSRRSPGSGAGREWPAGCSRQPRANSRTYRALAS